MTAQDHETETSTGRDKRQGQRRRPFANVSYNWMLPNMVTICGLIAGLTGFRMALEGRWETALALVMLAAVFDALDGRMARLLRATSAFGAALDSLTDAVVFGVVPALILYQWALADHGNIAWMTALFYAVCIILRLARFDSELPDKPEFAKGFFVGVPAPASAGLVLLPIAAAQVFDYEFLRQAVPVSGWLMACGIAAISTLPTFSGKTFRLPARSALPMLAAIGFAASLAVTVAWQVYIGCAFLYLLSILFSVRQYRRRLQAEKAKAGSSERGND